MTTKKEMARLIEQMADTPETTQWLRERNEAMRRSLRDISLSAVQYDAAGGRSGHGDSTAEKVLKRAETEERIRTNERAIRDRLRLHSDLSLVMAEALTTEERTIIWGKHAERLAWDRVARKARLSRTACFRKEAEGMEKLCRAWDVHKEKEEKQQQEKINEGAVEVDKLEADVTVDQTGTSKLEEAQQHIQTILKKNNLVNEDLKGIKIDLNF